MSRTVAVVFGGVSNENEISVITGTMAANVLKKGGDEVIPIYISQKGEFFTGGELSDISVFKNGTYEKSPRAIVACGGVYKLSKRGKIRSFTRVDAALNCCHGGSGEGGGVSGLFLVAKIPFAGAGVFESSAFLDKYLTKIVLGGLGVKRLPHAYVRALSDLPSCQRLGYPLIVKPSLLGSSIGVQKADSDEELTEAVLAALEYDSSAIVEPFVKDRREINCAAYFAGGCVHVSECEEALTVNELLSFEDKYEGGGRRVFPAEIGEQTANKIKSVTERVYSRLNMRGISRFDYILSGDDVYLSEVNTVPGSLAYYLLSDGLRDFYPVLDAVIEQARFDFSVAESKSILTTGILKNIPSNACKAGIK